MGTERFPIEGGHVLMFARSLGDTNAAYSDAAFGDTGFAGVTAGHGKRAVARGTDQAGARSDDRPRRLESHGPPRRDRYRGDGTTRTQHRSRH